LHKEQRLFASKVIDVGSFNPNSTMTQNFVDIIRDGAFITSFVFMNLPKEFLIPLEMNLLVP